MQTRRRDRTASRLRHRPDGVQCDVTDTSGDRVVERQGSAGLHCNVLASRRDPDRGIDCSHRQGIRIAVADRRRGAGGQRGDIVVCIRQRERSRSQQFQASGNDRLALRHHTPRLQRQVASNGRDPDGGIDGSDRQGGCIPVADIAGRAGCQGVDVVVGIRQRVGS